MKTLRLGLPLLLTLTAACSGISVTSDWDPNFDFAQPQTFTVLEETGGDDLPELMDNRVKNSLTNAMVARGYREVSDTSQADLAIGYQFTSDQRRSYSTVNTGWSGYGYGGYGGWYRYGGPTMTTSRTTENVYDVGQLLIAIFDTEARSMVFTSTGSRTLSDAQRSPQEMQQRIDDAVEDDPARFPASRDRRGARPREPIERLDRGEPAWRAPALPSAGAFRRVRNPSTGRDPRRARIH